MFLVALAAAAASPHSVTGAFGYTLGQAPPAKVAGCRANPLALTKTMFFACPGEGSFLHILVNARRNQVTDVTGTRRYAATRPDAALKSCLADLARMKTSIQRDRPEMFEVPPPLKSVTFVLAEQLMDGRFARGRTISGYCDPRPEKTAAPGSFVLLSVSYRLANEETVRLIHLDKAGAK